MTESSQRFALLRARYARSLVSKHAALLAAWRAFAEAADDATARELQGLVHRLAGSAPAYGYSALGTRASVVDHELMNWDDADPARRESASHLARRLSASMQLLIASLAQHAADATGESNG